MPRDCGKWSLALRQLTEALRLLDESRAPAEIGARVDHAICDLKDAIDRESGRSA
jgi:hypothetical protein